MTQKSRPAASDSFLDEFDRLNLFFQRDSQSILLFRGN